MNVREWLTTYVWAFLIIVIIAAIIYRAYFSPSIWEFQDYARNNHFVMVEAVSWCNKIELNQSVFEDGVEKINPMEVDCWSDHQRWCGFVFQGVLYYAKIEDYNSVVSIKENITVV